MITPLDTGSPTVLGFKLSGTLHDEDYRVFVPAVDSAVAQQGKIRLLVQFEDFHGWDLKAAWDDLKFGVTHYSAMERMAMVGDRRWEEWMAKLCKPFTGAEIEYFDASDIDAARAWLREGL